MPQRPNIVFLLTDQERYLPAWPSGFDVSGRQRLQELGATFTDHMIASWRGRRRVPASSDQDTVGRRAVGPVSESIRLGS